MNALVQHHWSDHSDQSSRARPPGRELKLSRRIRLLHRRELDSVLQPGWAVKGLIPQTGLAVVYGPSGAGKSFLLLDMVCAIAEGADWFGRRTTKAPIIYLCLEGAPGFVSRIRAWETAHKRALPELVRCSLQPFDLHDPDAVESLLDSVRGLMATLPEGTPAPILVVDTLSRATVGADENGPVAMGLTTNACARIAEVTGGLAILVHHTGKDMDRGMRGHNSLFAAADCVVLVQRCSEGRSFEVKKAKDGEDGIGSGFELSPVVLGLDTDGEEVRSCVVTPADAPPKRRDAVPRGIAPALRALKAVLSEQPNAEPPRALEKSWADAFLAAATASSRTGKASALSRARTALLKASLVVPSGEFLELTAAGTEMIERL